MSMHDEVRKRVRELRRTSWRWVKHSPNRRMTMCAVADKINTAIYSRPLSDRTVNAINDWVKVWSDGRWSSIVEYNDSPYGAKSVDDVIVVLEKFAAELQ